jgi:transcriptional regulator GlxA family with amidase domain
MPSVAVAVADGTPLFELAAACEVFGVDRGLADPWYDFAICGEDGAEVGGWLRAGIRYGLDALAGADTVIVPSCRDAAEPPPRALVEAVRAAHDAGARVASLCTGAFVLAEAGLLDGRRATTHWAHTDLLRDRYPAVRVDPDVLYIDDGRVLTSAGKAAGMDLCLHLVRADHGTAVANALARTLVVPPHRAGGQAQFIPAAVAHGRDHALAGLLPWALERMDRPLTVRDLAREAGMSSRNLARHFHAVTGTSPLRWLLNQRVRRAQELLETTDLSVEQVASRTGMGTATTLRRHFGQQVGVPPEAYRRTFRPARSRADARSSG